MTIVHGSFVTQKLYSLQIYFFSFKCTLLNKRWVDLKAIIPSFQCLHKLCKLYFFSVTVVLVFFICWTPFHAQRLMFVIVTLKGEWTSNNSAAHHILFLASGKPNKRVYTLYLILVHLPPCTILFGPIRLLIFEKKFQPA